MQVARKSNTFEVRKLERKWHLFSWLDDQEDFQEWKDSIATTPQTGIIVPLQVSKGGRERLGESYLLQKPPMQLFASKL